MPRRRILGVHALRNAGDPVRHAARLGGDPRPRRLHGRGRDRLRLARPRFPGRSRRSAQQDFYLIQAIVFVVAVMVVFVNIAIDVAYKFLDPRVTAYACTRRAGR